jgi:hypothetical protein
MTNEFDHIAKKVWFGSRGAIKLVEALTDADRMHVEERILALYGAKVHLFGTPDDIEASLEKARRSA